MRETKIIHSLRKKSIVFLIITVIGFLTYFNSIGSSFHFDDFINFAANPDTAIDELSYDSLKGAALTNISGLRPVSYLTFALNHYFSGMSTSPYHITNVLIHIVNAFLVYLIIIRLFSSAGDDDEKRLRVAASAFFTALFWLTAPINSQAVIFIVQRMTLLMTLFFLLAFYEYMLGRERKKPVHFILCGLFFVLSLLSKQNGVVLPLVIVVYELTMIRKGELKSMPVSVKGIMAGMLALMIVMGFIYSKEIQESIELGYQIRDFTMYERLLTQSRVIVFYLSLLILPLPGRFCVTHDIVISKSPLTPYSTLFAMIFVAALILFSVFRMKKSPYLSFALLWFFVTISVESTILPLELVFEHRMYLPCIFLIGAAVDFAVKPLHKKNMPAMISISVVIVILFSVSTHVRGRVWENETTLWSDVLKKYPENARAKYNIGYEYYRAKDYDNALKLFLKSAELDPGYYVALYAIGDVFEIKGDYAAAEKYYKMAEKSAAPGNDIHLKSLNNLGVVYIKTKRFKDAESVFNEILRLDPKEGLVHYNLGYSYEVQNRKKEAAKEYELALENGYRDPKVYKDALKILIMTGDLEGANRVYEKHKEPIDRLCISNFLKHSLAKRRNDKAAANKYYKIYKECVRSEMK